VITPRPLTPQPTVTGMVCPSRERERARAATAAASAAALAAAGPCCCSSYSLALAVAFVSLPHPTSSYCWMTCHLHRCHTLSVAGPAAAAVVAAAGAAATVAAVAATGGAATAAAAAAEAASAGAAAAAAVAAAIEAAVVALAAAGEVQGARGVAGRLGCLGRTRGMITRSRGRWQQHRGTQRQQQQQCLFGCQVQRRKQEGRNSAGRETNSRVRRVRRHAALILHLQQQQQQCRCQQLYMAMLLPLVMLLQPACVAAPLQQQQQLTAPWATVLRPWRAHVRVLQWQQQQQQYPAMLSSRAQWTCWDPVTVLQPQKQQRHLHHQHHTRMMLTSSRAPGPWWAPVAVLWVTISYSLAAQQLARHPL
jgi:hypothetical protein